MKLKLTVLCQFFLLAAFSQNESAGLIPNRVNEERFITINGIEQWVTIKGDSTKPVILFIHGGPGNSISPFSDAIYGKWEKDFVLVQWDQRGTGRTYGHNAPEELMPEYLKSHPLTIDQMTADGIELAQHLIQYLGKEKIILFGTSWGSVLGVQMAIKKPGLFYAYIGHSQVVNPSAAFLAAYQQVYKMAQDAKDQQSLDMLKSLGKPPYETAKNTGQLLRIIRKYQQQHAIPPPQSMFELSPGYDNKKDYQDRNDGEDYSFVNFAGDKDLGVPPLSSTINFLNDALAFEIPVYIVQGKEDIQTPEVLTKEYYDKLQAPEKKFIVVPKAEHGFNEPVINAQYEILKQLVLPSISGN